VVSTENHDLGYTPPPGVGNEAARQDQSFQVGTTQINEQSLRLLANGLQLGQRAEAFTRFGAEGDKNFLKYRQLRVWARGRGPGWEDGDLEFFLKVGKDADNFYYYHTPARTASWDPEVVITLDRWVALRTRIQQAWLAGDPPHVYPGCPAPPLVPDDTAYVMCDGAYIAHVKDPGGAPPNLAAVQELAAGIWRVGAATFIDQAEVWVDDIRLSDVVQNAGTAAALNVALTAANLADVSLDVSRRDGNFRQLGEDPSYQTNQAYSLVTTLHLERLLPPQWGLAAPLQMRYAAIASEPVFLAGTDLRGDALTGLRTPLSRARSFAFSLRRVRRASGGPARWLADPLSLTAAYTSGNDRSSLSAATARSFAVTMDYALQPRGATIPAAPRFLVALVRKLPPFIGKSGFADGLERARLRLSPTSVRLRSTLSGGDASQTVFRIPVADTGDRHLLPARSLTRVWRNSASLDLLPLSNVQVRGDLASTRDLRDYGDSSSIARVARLARKSLLGVDVGMETQRTIGTFYGMTPRFLPWLSPRVSLATGFSLTRDANGRAPVRTAGDSGAFHLPTAFSNSQRVELGTQLDLGRLGRGIFGDSSPISRALGALTSLDLGFNRDRTSTYSSLAAAPSLTYQLGLVGLAALRSQRDVPATGATDNNSRRAAGTVSLPLGFRVTGLYQRTSGTSWLLRFDGQVPTTTSSREWPSGNVSWTFSPPRTTIGRVLSGLTAQLSVRRRQTRNEQPGFRGSAPAVTTSDERTLAPGVTASWAHGILTSFDGTRLRTEQVTAGNTFRNTRTQQNASLAFAWRPPAALVRLKTDIRTTARYSYTQNATCLISSNQGPCRAYVDSRQTNAQLTLDTSFPPSLSAGLQMAYVLDDERQINRRIAQLVLTAFLQLNTSVGQVR
jgi:cell surface protein SprA